MSADIRWVDVGAALTSYEGEPGAFVDTFGVANQGPAWGVFCRAHGSTDGTVITAATADELADFLTHWAGVVRAGGVAS